MPLPINLLKAFDKGELKNIHLIYNVVNRPETRKAWLVLSGMITHITASTTILTFYNNLDLDELSNARLAARYEIVSTDTSDAYNLFGTLAGTASEPKPAFQFIVIDEKGAIYLIGNATVFADIQVLEWTP